MVHCGPSCAVPSCASTPTVGFGSAGGFGSGLGRLAYGYGGSGSGFSGLSYGFGGAERAANLGILDGVIPQPINQIPPSEVLILPPPCPVIIPGPILSASLEPVAVGGNTPRAVGGSGIVGGYGLRGGNVGRSSFGLGSTFLEGNLLVSTLDEPIRI